LGSLSRAGRNEKPIFRTPSPNKVISIFESRPAPERKVPITESDRSVTKLHLPGRTS